MPPEPTATAFVPGHVTAFFTVHRRDDPLATGSKGVGLALSEGIEVTVEPDEETTVTVNGRRVSRAPVAGVLDVFDREAAVRATTKLPAGAGFGVSGGLALGTALAANRAWDLGRSENDLVRVAHRAEVEAGTGLGDVVAQSRGGVPIREAPGAPPHGVVDRIPTAGRIEYLTFGDLDTASVITGDTEAVTAAGEAALARLEARPTLPAAFAAARQFARDSALLLPRVETVIADVTDVGGEACMAMLGETVVALGTGLSDAGYDASACRIHPAGAAVTPPENRR